MPGLFIGYGQDYCLMPITVPIARNFCPDASSASICLNTIMLPSAEMKPFSEVVSAASLKLISIAPLVAIALTVKSNGTSSGSAIACTEAISVARSKPRKVKSAVAAVAPALKVNEDRLPRVFSSVRPVSSAPNATG